MLREIKNLSRDDKYAIAGRIADLRVKEGYKSKDMAQYMGICANTYSDIECANVKLSLDNLYKLCQVFDVSADYIIFGETEDAYVAEVRTLFKKQRLSVVKKIVEGLKVMFG